MKRPFIIKPLNKWNPKGVYGVNPQPTNTLMFGVDDDGIVVSMKISDGITAYEDLKELLSSGSSSIPAIEVTYDELTTLIQQSLLVAGQRYILTDFASVYNTYQIQDLTSFMRYNYTGGVHQAEGERLLLTALKPNSLHSIAKSLDFDGDEMVYTIQNLNSGIWNSQKGTILRRFDRVKNNEANFDFRTAVILDFNGNLRKAVTFYGTDSNVQSLGNYGAVNPIYISEVYSDVKVYMNESNTLYISSIQVSNISNISILMPFLGITHCYINGGIYFASRWQSGSLNNVNGVIYNANISLDGESFVKLLNKYHSQTIVTADSPNRALFRQWISEEGLLQSERLTPYV